MRHPLLVATAISLLAAPFALAETTPTAEEMWKIIQQQQEEISRLKAQVEASNSRIADTEIKVVATADAVEAIGATGSSNKVAQWAEKTTISGYGEHHYNHYSDKNDEVDAHRFVLFVGHQFTDKLKLFSELEIEHGLTKDTADGSGPGEVELEQAYIQWDFAENHALVLGQYLVPVGLINETHEPNTFYGVERNKVESNIIPATWWETGAMVQGEIIPGLSYNAAIHSGLNLNKADKVRSGRQKSAKATAEDLAYTLRLKYTGLAGLELGAAVQHQSDLTQGTGAITTDASATLWEAHAALNKGPFALRALWASWDIDNDSFELAGYDTQEGWYIEPSYKITDKLGVFTRYSEYNNKAGLSSSKDAKTWDYGINYWLNPHVVLKADYSDNRDVDGADNDSLNLGIGWAF